MSRIVEAFEITAPDDLNAHRVRHLLAKMADNVPCVRDSRFVHPSQFAMDDIDRCKPIYETMPGWTDTTVGVTDYAQLPANARRYLDRIQEVTGVPIAMVSTSPDRDHTILLHNPYSAV